MKYIFRIIAFLALLIFVCLLGHINDSEALKKQQNYYYVNGNPVELYITYQDKYEALNYIAKRCRHFIALINNKYGLNGLNDTNWEDYYTYFFYEMEEIDYDNESLCDEMYELLRFFDIYENYAKNKDIIERINTTIENGTIFNSSAEVEEEFKNILPYKK